MENKEKIKQINCRLYQVIGENIKKKCNDIGISEENLCKLIEEKTGFSIGRSYLNRCINHPQKFTLPLSFLLAYCDCFKITFEELISEEYVDEIKVEVEEKVPLLKSSLLECYKKDSEQKSKSDDIVDSGMFMKKDSYFIEDPKSSLMQKYMNDYFCYYYPTVSEENSIEAQLMTGKLKLYEEDNKCKAELIIDTNTLNKEGESNFKVYQGDFVLSTAVQAVHCILRSEQAGEYCVIVFRHSHVNFDTLHCRMAEVITCSATVDKRYPTILRMFLSSEEIHKEDLKYLAPHLCLNYSNILLTEQGLLSLEDEFPYYKDIVDSLLEEKDSELMYPIKEADALQIAQKYLAPNELSIFLSELRSKSFAYHYNKVSPKLDSTVWKLLNERGYYQKKKKN